jgi:hypothetical protein
MFEKYFIRKMPKTLEGVTDSGRHTCALSQGMKTKSRIYPALTSCIINNYCIPSIFRGKSYSGSHEKPKELRIAFKFCVCWQFLLPLLIEPIRFYQVYGTLRYAFIPRS